jgi:hypothetical protein
MIDFKEIENYERFEDLCERMLSMEGLITRRLGRGPGQHGKDVVATEELSGPLSKIERRAWLVECKFTKSDGSIGEENVQNVRDRIDAQRAYGFMLFTNARLKVNLEKTLNGLNKAGNVGIRIWTAEKIAEKVILNTDLFRSFFPNSFDSWIKKNRIIYINHIKKFKSPLVHIQNNLRLIEEAPENIMNIDLIKEILSDSISTITGVVNDLDENLKIIENQ